MSIILFIAILVVLILVHELGHFLVAKRFGIRVDEFGLGYPPKVAGWKKGETTYTLNLLPLGGFVKIFGEDPNAENTFGPDNSRSFVHKSARVQAAVLAAGVTANIVFAWLAISLGYLTGLPSPADSEIGIVQDARTTVVLVQPESPAYEAGLKAGDRVLSVSSGDTKIEDPTSDQVASFIVDHQNQAVSFGLERGGEELVISATPVEGIVEGQKAVGVSTQEIGVLRLPLHRALWEGIKTTGNVLVAIVVGIATLLWNAIQGNAALSQVSGPIGIVGLVGDASALGFAYILSFTAFISLNLAVINLIPFPALDGGRILFVAIEAIRGKRLDPKITNTANLIGFVLLLGLMAAVTFNDIARLF